MSVNDMAMPTVVLHERTFISKVYGWMAFALVLTGLVAWATFSTPLGKAVWGNPALFYGALIGELLLVIGLSAGINKMSAATATGVFVLYSALNGLTLSVIFVMFTAESIA